MPVQNYSGDYFIKLLEDLYKKSGVSLPQADFDSLRRLVDEERQREDTLKSWMRSKDQKISPSALDLPISLIYSTKVESPTPQIEIPISGGFRHLMIFSYSLSDRNDVFDWIHGRFNDDTGNNYMEGYIGESSGSATGWVGEQTSRDDFGVSFSGAALSTAGAAGGSVIFIPHYDSTNWKSIFKMSGAGGANTTLLVAIAIWKSTSAITKLTVFPEFGTNIEIGSNYSVIGIK